MPILRINLPNYKIQCEEPFDDSSFTKECNDRRKKRYLISGKDPKKCKNNAVYFYNGEALCTKHASLSLLKRELNE